MMNGGKKTRRLWLALLALTAAAALAVVCCGDRARDLPKEEAGVSGQ